MMKKTFKEYGMRYSETNDMDTNQVYIDPFYISGNVMRARLIWDWNTRMDVRLEFDRLIKGDKLKIISFISELMRRSGIDFVLTRQQFINIQFKEFPGIRVKIENIVF